jgi:hypothetical protein
MSGLCCAGSPKERVDFVQVFQSLMVSLAVSASLDILRCLMHALREGSDHLLFAEVVSCCVCHRTLLLYLPRPLCLRPCVADRRRAVSVRADGTA